VVRFLSPAGMILATGFSWRVMTIPSPRRTRARSFLNLFFA
jgi:hypothetical protein